MKDIILGTFASVREAEQLIEHLHKDMNIAKDEISYAYRNADGDVEEVEVDRIVGETPREGAKAGAKVGGTVGALAGIATVIGVIPVIGPIFAAGPLVGALGLGAGALGTTVAGALTGAAAGGLIGALTRLGAPEEDAKGYEERVRSGEVLVVVHAEDPENKVHEAFTNHHPSSINVYTPAI